MELAALCNRPAKEAFISVPTEISDERSEKERNIAFFKKSFSNQVEVDVIWRLNVPTESKPE